MLILLITGVLAIRIYPITQIQNGLTFQLEYNGGSMTVDLSSDLTLGSMVGEPIACNSIPFGEQIKCQDCKPNCMISDSELQASQVQMLDVREEEEIESMLYVMTNESDVLGLGPRRGQPGFPQNPFVSSIFHLCFGQTKGFITREFKNPYNYELHYDSNKTKYQVDLKQLTINNRPICNISTPTYLDSLQPYISLPSHQYEQIKAYFSQYGVVEKQHLLVMTNESAELPPITLIFEDDIKITMNNESYVYTLEDEKKIVAFYKSNQKRVILGLPFLSQKLITINQEKSALYFSNYDCQGQFDQIQRSTNFITQVLVPFIFIVSVFYCILTQKDRKEAQKRHFEQQEMAKLKEDEEEI